MPQAAVAAMSRLIDSDLSIEISPESVATFRPETLAPGSKVFLTHLSGKPDAAQVEAARVLIGLGYTPVVHMAARNFADARDFAKLIEAHARNGVRHGLFLGGNPRTSNGPFDAALDLLRHPAARSSGFTTAFIGGYPEGHPDISQKLLDDARAAKIDAAREAGLAPHLVTQFAFDGTVMADWSRRMHTLHPGVPVRLGVAGVTSLPKLIKFAVMCGVGPSLSVLRKNAGGLMNVLTEHNPGDLLRRIERAYPEGVSAIDLHVFPFGGWRKTLDWVAEERA